MTNRVEQDFSEFYEKWIGELEDLLRLLIQVMIERPQDSECEAIVNKVTAHHKEFYTHKWAAAHEDVLAVFSPVWLSPLEIAHLWITGWMPSIAFRLTDSLRASERLASSSLIFMTDDQVMKYEKLRMKVKMEEERVDREMERQQVGIADRKMVELAELDTLARNSCNSTAVAQVDALVDVAMNGLMAELKKVMKMADCARMKTLKGMLNVLTPTQSVDFLAAHTMLQIYMMKWGKQSV